MSLPPPAAVSPSLIRGYAAAPGAYNELANAHGQLRPAWESLVQRFDTLGPDVIRQRWAAAQRVIQENGVTYNVYGDPKGIHRPWELDPVPLMLGADEWTQLEAAVIQRARLLETIVADLYGPNTLIQNRDLPAELVYANPNFLRPCANITPPGGHFLTLQAFDLARSPEGRWWVVNDRTQAPSGAGYALENRQIVSRSLPDLFRDVGVSRLTQFFTQLRDTLAAMSPRATTDPHMALLTPGPGNQTYFEHAYLARHLGFTLVEAGDLTVRDDIVFLKTLGALQRIDVLWRRTDDSFCDPLELRGDSTLGVAGLVQAYAAGNIAIANALGTGLIETQSLMPFLPALSTRLLGEDLKLPSVATWWCGQPDELMYVLEHLDELVIKPAFSGDSMSPVFGAALTTDQRQELKQRITQRPHRFVAQESIALSTAPVWHDPGFHPRHFMLRVYVAANPENRSGDHGYTVMPGGLARVSAAHDSMVVSMQYGGGSKDAWVLSPTPVNAAGRLPADVKPVPVVRTARDLPSRVADTMYWLGRYVERAENLNHLLRANLLRLTQETSPYGSPEQPKLFDALTRTTGRAHPMIDTGDLIADHATAMNHLTEVVFNAESPASLAACTQSILELGSIVRDRISVDTWRALRQMRGALRQDGLNPLDPTHVLTCLEQLAMPFASFAGLTNESMMHGPGWRFLDMGRRVERAFALVERMHTLLVDPDAHEPLVLTALLATASSEMTYRSRYRMNVRAMPVIDLLLLDESNPRSVAFQLRTIEQHLAALPGDLHAEPSADADHEISSVLATLQQHDAESLATIDGQGRREPLAALLESLSQALPAFSDRLIARYLAHAQPRWTQRQTQSLESNFTHQEETI
ncbi:MAG: circularly permuted type 2 ATP-grasp protein [Planctomycetota bacterium]